jgi:RHH-type proline utilization regulon transcriptional repressor/proline dehydrogenase/delta 1-pyrroline-5-carboxylate dehydrogenase
MFKNEALTNFNSDTSRETMNTALAALERRIQHGTLKACPIIGGQEIHTGRENKRIDPAESEALIGITELAGKAEMERAITLLHKRAGSWAATPARNRADVLHTAARLMRQRKFDLSALIIREAGKPWREADADVAEAIDFCDYYALEMLRLGTPHKTQEVTGEDNYYSYAARGVCAVISPWNFPLAIACGMAGAALVAGNAVLLKPARQTSLIAFELCRILLEAGVPPEILAFLPSSGDEIGNALVESPLLDMICFTGSKAVGLDIIQRASVVQPGQRNVKKVVAEMGGKNAVIVDEDAELDDTIKLVLSSAYGFSGQKCSACSRLIVHQSIYETFIERLSQAASDLIIGKPADSASFMGPVIDAASQKRILGMVEEARKESTLAFMGQAPADGCYVPPVIFRDIPATSRLWREEVFGPVLAVRPAASFDEALTMANDCEYALTGGVFSRNPAHLELARRNFAVGNLYLNRSCTGALVQRQPFGGSRMSGVGSKAGGPDYLLQFLDPRTVSENTMRRGFVAK